MTTSLWRDAYGVELGAKDDAAVGLFDQAVHELVALDGEPGTKALAAAEADGELVLARVLLAYLHCYVTSKTSYAEARAVLGAGSPPAGERDRAHFQAAWAWAGGDMESAARHLERALLANPRDLLALKIAQDLYFFMGDQVSLRDVAARVLPAWPRGAPGSGFVEAMWAFGLEECGDYRGAERHGRAALDAYRGDVWAVHCVVHVLEMQARAAEGLAFIGASSPDWRQSFFAPHNWWHSALYHLALGQEADALAVYDGPVTELGLASPLYQVDASSLLWRLWLQGTDVGGRGKELADAISVGLGGSTYCFNDWHAVMALCLDHRMQEAERLVADVPGAASGTNKMMVDRAGRDVMTGVLKFAQGQYPAAVELLWEGNRHASVFGGSHAQRDAIELTLLAAAAAAGDRALVAAILSARAARKPTDQVTAQRVVDANQPRARVNR